MPTDTHTAADNLDEAYAAYLRDGDGSGDCFVAAYDYREEGYRIGSAVYGQPADEHESLIEGECAGFPTDAIKLIWRAAEYRIAVLAKAERLAA